jgi:hypothetical protein
MSKGTTPPWQPLVDAAVERLADTRRTFTEEEAFAGAWEAGYDISPQDDPRFVLAAEADGRHPHHWRLSTHTLANNRLLDALRTGAWDGREIDQELAQLDAQDGVHYVFCPVDPRFTLLRDRTYTLTDQEPDIVLPSEIKVTLDALGSALLDRWREVGTTPWTTRALTETVAALGWAAATEGSNWLLVRAWLRSWPAVTSVGQDYWMLTDALPHGPVRTHLSVLPLRVAGPATSNEPANLETESTPRQPIQQAEQDTPDLVPSVASLKTGLLVHWVETLRTVHLTQGFLPIPAAARNALPPRAREADKWEALRGTWFEDKASFWAWLDREGEQLCGPDLANKLMWCEAGQKLRVDWNMDEIIFRLVGEDVEVQQEETRLVDLEALAALRGGLGESYRRSLFTLLSSSPQGLTFQEIVEALRARQGHAVHRGTIRALLSAGGFVRREGRWYVGLDNETGARQLRSALAQTLLPATTTDGEPNRSRFGTTKRIAYAIQTRLREITISLSGY